MMLASSLMAYYKENFVLFNTVLITPYWRSGTFSYALTYIYGQRFIYQMALFLKIVMALLIGIKIS